MSAENSDNPDSSDEQIERVVAVSFRIGDRTIFGSNMVACIFGVTRLASPSWLGRRKRKKVGF